MACCCYPRKSDVQVSQNPRDVEASLRNQLLSSWQYIYNRDQELKDIKAELKTLREQNERLHKTLESNQVSVKQLKRSSQRHRSRAHRYRKDNIILCEHLKALTQNHPALAAEESEIVSQAITRHRRVGPGPTGTSTRSESVTSSDSGPHSIGGVEI